MDTKNCPFISGHKLLDTQRGSKNDLDFNKIEILSIRIIFTFTSLFPVTKSVCGCHSRKYISIGTYFFPFFIFNYLWISLLECDFLMECRICLTGIWFSTEISDKDPVNIKLHHYPASTVLEIYKFKMGNFDWMNTK